MGKAWRIVFPIFLILAWTHMPFAAEKTTLKEQAYDNIYKIGEQISEGIGLSIVTGLTAVDPELKYSIKTSKDTFSSLGHAWPILDVLVDTESKKIGNNKITFVLILEADPASQVVVGTVKNTKVNGKVENSLQVLNNTMYIETDEGTEQVKMVNGKLYFVEPR